MRIAIDAAGGDSGVRPLVEGACRAAFADGHELLFFGPAEPLRSELRSLGVSDGDPRVGLTDCPAVFDPGADSSAACRESLDTSLMRALESVGAQKALAAVSAAHPRAALACGLWHLKRLRGVLRPAAACLFPTAKGRALLLDAGGNADCKPWHLLQFALMGSLYAQHVLGNDQPSVGLLCPGGDSCGDPELVRETLPLLKYAGLRFAGRIRADALAAGEADVVVCDGATGDLCMRLAEGLTSACFEILQSEFGRGAVPRLRRALAGPALRAAEEAFRGVTTRPSPVLGLGNALVLCRGGRSAEMVAGAVRGAVAFARSGVAERIQQRLEDVKSDMEFVRTGE
ncbi:MAG: hypothetical protein WC728_07020 [Elusimicrobiota bacterium]